MALTNPKTIGEKELKTSYKGDTLEVGKEMGLLPQGHLGIKSRVLSRNRIGIG